MQWNKVNMSKDELKRRQEKYIKEALEISKKAKVTEEISTPVIISIPQPETAIEEAEGNTEAVTMVVSEEADTEAILVTESEEAEEISAFAEHKTTEEVDTTASEEITDNSYEEESPEDLFENVFITEEEAERKLSETETASKEISEDAPDFEGYIKNHNQRSENNKSDNFADE